MLADSTAYFSLASLLLAPSRLARFAFPVALVMFFFVWYVMST